MAQLEKMITFLIFWETGVQNISTDTETLFKMAKAKGITKTPADRGGSTLAGVTLGTYNDYCRRRGRALPTASDLSRLTYPEWLAILKTMFWDRWQADNIRDQRIAEMLVDWVWTSGAYGITIPQRVLGVKADGVVGPRTLAAVNSRDPKEFFDTIKQERIAYVERICRRRAANCRFRTDWLRRINSI